MINRLRAPDAESKARVPIDYIAHPLDEGLEQLDTPTDGSYIDYGIRVTELTWCVVRDYSDALREMSRRRLWPGNRKYRSRIFQERPPAYWDVQFERGTHLAEKQASIAARSPRAPRQLRKPKPKAELDERGRFRHTLRLTPQSEQKLREIAESIGVDLHGAISVCIATYHQTLAKPCISVDTRK